MELPRDIFDEITRLTNKGNELLDNQHDTVNAYKVFEEALNLLPEPVDKWEAFAWLQSSLGECKFIEREYNEAYEHFRQAYNASAPNANAYMLLRVGECAFELGLDHAQNFLMQAYMIAGKDIFKVEPSKYYKTIEPVIKSNTNSPKSEKTAKAETKRLVGDKKELLEKNINIASEYYEKQDWEHYFGTVQDCLDCIPEPKYEYAECFELLMVYFPNACKIGYAKDMLKFIPLMEQANLSRADVGDREYYIAIIYYENGMIDEAKKMFAVADKKSRGRAIMDKKYKKIYKEWKKAGLV